VKVYKLPIPAVQYIQDPSHTATIFHGDCLKLLKALPSNSIDFILTSPPYCIGKEYEKGMDIESFKSLHSLVLPEVARVLKDGGSMCWEVGYHVNAATILPLDFVVHDLVSKIPNMQLRNRIIWAYGHGLHSETRFSGRHETILWYTKGDQYEFDLDPVRVPQKYPGKTHYKGPKKGEPSGNPLGKNPSDVWDDIPNVKANHIEKTAHPCQFPVALAERLILSLAPEGGIVLDPFSGVSSTGVASIRCGCRYIGAELSANYVRIAEERLRATLEGTERVRELNKPIFTPEPGSKVATAPSHFVAAQSTLPATDDFCEAKAAEPVDRMSASESLSCPPHA